MYRLMSVALLLQFFWGKWIHALKEESFDGGTSAKITQREAIRKLPPVDLSPLDMCTAVVVSVTIDKHDAFEGM